MATDAQTLLQKATGLTPEQVRTLWNNPSLIRAGTIGSVLSMKPYQSGEEIVAELCKEMGLDFMKDIPYNDISSDLVRDIAINYAKQNFILPFKEEADVVHVLIANPLNVKCLDDIKVIFGKHQEYDFGTKQLESLVNLLLH